MTDQERQYPPIILQSEIKRYLQQYIKGQKKGLNLLAYLGHLYSVEVFGMSHDIRKQSLPKLNCLVTAATGGGKSFIIHKLAEFMKSKYPAFFYTRIDCGSVSAEGWHGTNASEYIFTALSQSPNGIGILHLDEIDKLSSTGLKYADNKQAIQEGLLELLDGTYAQLYENKKDNKTYMLNKINNCLIIMSGSFQSVREKDKRGKLVQSERSIGHKRSIGFTSHFDSIKEKDNQEKSWKARMRELGFMAELSARILHEVELDPYSKEDIKNIILNGKESPYNKYRNISRSLYELSDAEINDIVDSVFESENGLREIESVLFDTFYKRSFKS